MNHFPFRFEYLLNKNHKAARMEMDYSFFIRNPAKCGSSEKVKAENQRENPVKGGFFWKKDGFSQKK